MFEKNPKEVEKIEKAKNKNSYLKECEKRLDEYKKLAKLYDDKDFLKSLEGEKWCSKERYDKHEDTREMFYAARKKSLAFCNYWFSEALKSSEKYNDPAGRLMLRKLAKEEVCPYTLKGRYESAKMYREYVSGITRKK